jgi:starch phosphorylase
MTNPLEPFLHSTRIAYFSMELTLRPEMHTYSGGLGVLGGDTARSAADLELPMAFVSLVSRAGYVRQQFDSRGLQNLDNPWRPEDWAQPLQAMVAVQIEGREVWIRPWLYLLTCPLGHRVPVLLLDTDLNENREPDREITHRLYGGDDAYRLKQEIVLGIGGAMMLQALGFRIRKFHLNEGHAALLTLYLLRQFPSEARDIASGSSRYEHTHVRRHCVFTTHTPVEAAFDKFPYPLVERILGQYVEIEELKRLAGPQHLNMTQLALSLSGYVNGVSQRHAEVSSRLFPGYHIRAITNGVHAPTWTHDAFARLYAARFPNWAHEPELLLRADQLPDEAIWAAHQTAKRELLALVSEQTGIAMREDVPLVGFARRMTEYKRPDLLFSDLDRLSAIARARPFQVLLSGLSHPRDERGTQFIASIRDRARQLADSVPVAFLTNYSTQIAGRMTAGADIWLNTPLPPLEASGTSGMKAALNGGLNLSVLDGWWAEAHIEGVTGWSIGSPDEADSQKHADDLYRKLSQVVLPLYYDERPRWIWMMKQAISKIGSYYNSSRMMRRYATEAYFR